MVFSSLPFLFVFLPLTMLFYYIVPRRFKNAVLLLFSLIFYSYGEPVYIFLMLFSILMNYISGLLLGKFTDSTGKKKAVMIINVIINLALLGVFKYTGLIVGALTKIPALSELTVPEIALPIGISFYTFQTMSYVIDVYRGNCKPQKNIVTFGAYVSLFPQLIAGPIVRYIDVEEQLQTRKESLDMFTKGIGVFTIGLAKKVLIANSLGFVWDQIKAVENPGVLGAWIGIIAFTFQIYFDFSGYSDMAVGLGNMFGFTFVRNFDYPYTSKSITEFWRRWHISLGTWFREYVYIPLGGNRKGKARQCLNIFIVWGLTGIWHGAGWNFLFWGLYFGLLLTIEKFFLYKRLQKLPAFVSHIYTMVIVIFGWVLFDFTDTPQMFSYIGSMFNFTKGFISADIVPLIISNIALFVIAIIACLPLGRKLRDKVCEKKVYPYIETVLIVLAVVLSVASLVNSTYNPFLYFRF